MGYKRTRETENNVFGAGLLEKAEEDSNAEYGRKEYRVAISDLDFAFLRYLD